MGDRDRTHLPVEEQWEESPRKRQRTDSRAEHFNGSHETDIHHERHTVAFAKEKNITSASTAKLAPQAVAPFLAKHVPSQYAPLGIRSDDQDDVQRPVDPNSKYCYRHRPDMLCRKQADEPSMEALQKVSHVQHSVSALANVSLGT